MRTPILPAYLAITRGSNSMPTAQLVIWCPHCKKPHWHGMPPGNRVAHCDQPESPYKVTGYVLAFAGCLPKIDMKAKPVAAFLKRKQGAGA